MSASATEADLFAKALRVLALREHSRLELAKKLASLTEDSSLIEQVLDKLAQSDYLNDQRYAEMLVRSSVSKGYGPLKLAHLLREKGVNSELAKTVLDAAEIDWQALAAYQRQKKFGDTLPRDWPERARQSRFLAGRGFYLETINAVFHEKC